MIMCTRMYSKLCSSIYVLIFSLLVSSCAIDTLKRDDKNQSGGVETITVSDDVQEQFDIALKLLKESRYDEAIVLLESVIENEKRLVAPYANLGIAYGRINDLKKSEAVLLMAVEIENTHPIANNELGLIFRKTGRFNEAKLTYERILSEHPNYLPAVKNLGVLCEIYLHDFECALTQFEEYLKYYPDDKTVGIWVADLKRRLK